MSELPGHAPETFAEAEVELEALEVDAPRVGIVMGSKSDLERMEAAEKELIERGIRCEVRVMSAHREPDKVADYARNARMRGIRVIIAGAGLSAALPGVVAAHSDLPVIGVPLTSRTSVAGGLDADRLRGRRDLPGQVAGNWLRRDRRRCRASRGRLARR